MSGSWQGSLLRRAEWLKERIPVAMANLKAAQHRDRLRYEQLQARGICRRWQLSSQVTLCT
jgi:hypothetical protein